MNFCVFNSCVIIVVSIFSSIYACGPNGSLCNENEKRKLLVQDSAATSDDGSFMPGMWFGPRLGKRAKRQQEVMLDPALYDERTIAVLLKLLKDNEISKAEGLENFDIPTFLQALNGSKKRFFTPRLGRDSSEQQREPPKRDEEETPRTVNFIPRLGRELPQLAAEQDEEYRNRIQEESRSYDARPPPHFSPRLGRTFVNFSPRLGRGMPNGIYYNGKLLTTRYTRSAEKHN